MQKVKKKAHPTRLTGEVNHSQSIPICYDLTGDSACAAAYENKLVDHCVTDIYRSYLVW